MGEMRIECIRSLPPGTRTKEDIDRQIAEERDTWGGDTALLATYDAFFTRARLVVGAHAVAHYGWSGVLEPICGSCDDPTDDSASCTP